VYSDQAYVDIDGTLSSPDETTVRILITDACDEIIYVGELEKKAGSHSFTEKIHLPDGMDDGFYTVFVSAPGNETALTDTFIFVKDVALALNALNGALAKNPAELQAELTRYQAVLGLTADEIAAVSQTVFEALAEQGSFTGLNEFKTVLLVALALDSIKAAADSGQLKAILEGTAGLRVDMTAGSDYSKLHDSKFVFDYIHSSNQRTEIDAKNEKLLIKLFNTGVVLGLANEITTGNKTDIARLLDAYKLDLNLISTPEWSDYESASGNAKGIIASKMAAPILSGAVLREAVDLLKLFVSAVKSYESEAADSVSYRPDRGGTGGGSRAPVVITAPVSLPAAPPPDETEKRGITEVFYDLTSTTWAIDSIAYLYERKIINGVGGNAFAPGEAVTREQFVKMLCEAFQLTRDDVSAEFDDIEPGSWPYKYVASLNALGIINGIGDSLFGFGLPVTREDMAVICFRLLSAAADVPLAEPAETAFADNGAISEYAVSAVAALNALGIINGSGGNRFEPKSTATRAEAAKITSDMTKSFVNR
jgi:hypothetical protein